MELSSAFFATGALLSIVYCCMGISALLHIPKAKKHLIAESFPTFFFWWPFFGSLFDERANKLRGYGKLVALSMALAYTSSAVVKSGICT